MFSFNWQETQEQSKNRMGVILFLFFFLPLRDIRYYYYCQDVERCSNLLTVFMSRVSVAARIFFRLSRGSQMHTAKPKIKIKNKKNKGKQRKNHTKIGEDFKTSTTELVKKNPPHRPKLSIFKVSLLRSLIYYMSFRVLCFSRFVSNLEMGLRALQFFPMGFDLQFNFGDL